MNFFISMKRLARKINKIDAKTRDLFNKSIYSSNPFSPLKNETIAWVDEVKNENMCKSYEKKNKNKEN